MRAPLASRASGVERTFGPDEIIVSKTNLKGHITYANDVFLRVSAFTEPEVIGQPHNLIRHPDMPRAIFALLWDTLRAGNELFAYVLNLSGDGAHYWVLAHVTPSTDVHGQVVGYHSNRRSPGRQAVTVISELYGRLRTAERAKANPTEALATSRRMLADELSRCGQTYDEFVWELTG